MALKGAELIVNISAVPKTFPVEYMWRRMAGAAIFNQVFVVYANRPGEFFSGHSAIFDPRGDVVANAGSEEAVIEADVHMEDVHQWRRDEAIYSNRRPLLYRAIGFHQHENLELNRTPAQKMGIGVA
jgi:omega-amidase